jgi:hypothetical protein
MIKLTNVAIPIQEIGQTLTVYTKGTPITITFLNSTGRINSEPIGELNYYPFFGPLFVFS